MMMHWIVNTDLETSKVLQELHTMSYGDRKKDPRALDYVQKMRKKWSAGTQVERLATLGWIEYESLEMFCSMLEHLPKILAEYKDNIDKHGRPTDITQANVTDYEKEADVQRKAAEKKLGEKL